MLFQETALVKLNQSLTGALGSTISRPERLTPLNPNSKNVAEYGKSYKTPSTHAEIAPMK